MKKRQPASRTPVSSREPIHYSVDSLRRRAGLVGTALVDRDAEPRSAPWHPPERAKRCGIQTNMDWNDTEAWLLFGFLGNLIFSARFLVQWVASERARRSIVPVSFWYLSVAGSLVLLVYALHRRDPIFTLAYLPNAAVYLRNLMLIHRTRNTLESVATTCPWSAESGARAPRPDLGQRFRRMQIADR